jgi:hypothetical protein
MDNKSTDNVRKDNVTILLRELKQQLSSYNNPIPTTRQYFKKQLNNRKVNRRQCDNVTTGLGLWPPENCNYAVITTPSLPLDNRK